MTTTDFAPQSTGFACGAEDGLAISIWDSPPTLEHARAAAGVLEAVGRAHKRVLVLAVLGPGTQPPSGPAREVLSTQLGKMGDRIAAAASVFETEGFRAATLRAVVTGILFVVRPGYPQRTCTSVSDAALWLAARSEGRMDAARIEAAVRSLRSRAR